MRKISLIFSLFFVLTVSAQFQLNPKTPIEPMIKCNFYQSSEPFINQTPIVLNNYGEEVHAPVGCAANVVSQIMYYYKNEGCKSIDAQYIGAEYAHLEALPSTKFNWDLILSSYETSYTKEQGDEIAKLMKYVGYALQTEYSYNKGGSWMRAERLPLLGFSSESYETYGKRLSDKELDDLLNKELEKGRPVAMAAYGRNGGGHWFLIDGRDDTGRFHVHQYGYYILSQELFMSDDENKPQDLLHKLNDVWCVVPIMPKDWTSIDKATYTANNNGRVYSLNGQYIGDSLEGLPKGIYIRGGKKFIVR